MNIPSFGWNPNDFLHIAGIIFLFPSNFSLRNTKAYTVSINFYWVHAVSQALGTQTGVSLSSQCLQEAENKEGNNELRYCKVWGQEMIWENSK